MGALVPSDWFVLKFFEKNTLRVEAVDLAHEVVALLLRLVEQGFQHVALALEGRHLAFQLHLELAQEIEWSTTASHGTTADRF